ncbi:hypothetical protein C8F04DRAFT_1111772 [Mycena alexandri]|uniref:Chromodomain-helicase-DNA-binding protein 1-like C-terminal domain-containing protein n=1 Tax=Mycena alexandri TaxID=1745969 RepID=A0AAD6WZN2_9AGAR|nr:hypothetical protein C8F04DRAFT_1111772 [Mycena alexandri]
MSLSQSLGNATTSTPRTFAPSKDQSIEYTEHRSQEAPSVSLGILGDIYLDTKAPALFARCDAGWTRWPGPQVRGSALSHPAFPDHFLWASPVQGRVLWAPKPKMNKLIGTAMEVLNQVIAADRRRDGKNLKRKAGEAPAGGDAKKARVSDVATSSATPVEHKPPAQPSTSQPASSANPPPPSADPILRNPALSSKPSATGVSKPANVPKPPISEPTTTRPPITISVSKPPTSSVSKPPTASTTRPSTATTPVSDPPPRIVSKAPAPSFSKPPTPSISTPSTATSVQKPSTTTNAPKPSPPTAPDDLLSPLKRAAPSAADTEDEGSHKRQRVQSNPPTPCPNDVAKEMEQVTPELKQLKSATPPERSRCLAAVGRHVEQILIIKEKERERWRPLLWDYAASFWHKKTNGPELEEGYRLLLAREATDQAASGSGSMATTSGVGPPEMDTPPRPTLPSASASSAPPLPKPPAVLQFFATSARTKSTASKALPPSALAAPPQSKPVASGASKASSKNVHMKPAPSAPSPLPSSTSAPPSASSIASTSKASSKPAPRTPAKVSSSLPSASHTPGAPNPSSLPGASVTPTPPAANSVFAGILTLIQNNAKTLNSGSAKAAPPSPSPVERSKVPAARTLSSSSAESQVTLASHASDRAGGAGDGRPQQADSGPTEARRRRQSSPSGNRTDVTPSASTNSPTPISPAPTHPLPPLREPRRRLPGSKAASDRLKEEEAAIVRLRHQHTRCRSDAAPHRQGNAHWEAESAVAAALIETLTAVHAALKLENGSLKEENARLKGVKRLKGLLQSLGPQHEFRRKEETRVDMDEGARAGHIVSDSVESGQREEQMVLDGDVDERTRRGDSVSGVRRGDIVSGSVESGQREEQMVLDGDVDERTRRGDSVSGVRRGDIVSDSVESGQREEQMVIDGDVDERTRRGDSVSGARRGDNVAGNVEPEQKGEQMMVEEDVVQNAFNKVLVKQEPATSIPLANKPPVDSNHPEIIDLTLDSDDEDAAPPRPLSTSAASVPVSPIHPVKETEPQRDEPLHDGSSDRPDPMDVPMSEDTDPLDTFADPSTQFHRQDTGLDPGASPGTPSAPVSPPTLVKPSAAGYFRIVGTDFDYSDEHLLKIVLRNNGVNNNSRDGDWGAILAQLQLTSNGHSPSADTFELSRWYKTVDALRDYYAWYLAPRSSLTEDMVPPPANNSSEDAVEPPRDTLAPPVVSAAVAEVSPERETCRIADASRAPSLPGSSGELAERAIDSVSHCASTPLLDPAICKNTFRPDKIKVEENGNVLDVRELIEPQLLLVFPYHEGDSEYICTWCPTELQRATNYPVDTPLEELSAHVKGAHPVMFELLLAQTQGMDRDTVQVWFEGLIDDDEEEEKE